MGDKGSLGNIGLTHFELMITSVKVNLGEDTGPIHLIKEVFDLGQRLFVLDGHIIELVVVHI